MGGLMVKYEEAGYLDDKSEDVTPKKVLRNKRLLALDPRSPSEGIARTPIIVEKTPVLGSGRANLCSSLEETPKIVRNSDNLQDPRSPTVEFSRTPINPCYNVSRQVDPPVMKDVSFKDSPMSLNICDTESGIESTEVTPVLKYRRTKGCTIQPAESPDSALGFDAWKQSQTEFCDQILQTEKYPLPADESNPALDPVAMETNDENIFIPANSVMMVSEENEANFPYGYAPYISRKTGSMCMTSREMRSPLSLVENSKALSQRNFTVPSGGKQTPKYSQVDKENLYH